mmetsp:Transcript_22887/g.75923  ORF Transcript_22887/g.75923 Transcript_22887/m.75923 type:complete len:204 (+) Transcript_22887:777-1388(+)
MSQLPHLTSLRDLVSLPGLRRRRPQPPTALLGLLRSHPQRGRRMEESGGWPREQESGVGHRLRHARPPPLCVQGVARRAVGRCTAAGCASDRRNAPWCNSAERHLTAGGGAGRAAAPGDHSRRLRAAAGNAAGGAARGERAHGAAQRAGGGCGGECDREGGRGAGREPQCARGVAAGCEAARSGASREAGLAGGRRHWRAPHG